MIVWLIKFTSANGAPERSRAKRSVSFACEFWHGCWVGRRVKCLSQEVPGIAGSDPITTQYSVAILAQSTHTNRGIQAHPCTLVWCSSAAMSLNGVFDDGAENSENDRHFIGYEPNVNEESDSSLKKTCWRAQRELAASRRTLVVSVTLAPSAAARPLAPATRTTLGRGGRGHRQRRPAQAPQHQGRAHQASYRPPAAPSPSSLTSARDRQHQRRIPRATSCSSSCA